MTKNINWRLATIRLWVLTTFFCGASVLTSCSNEDNYIFEDPFIRA